VARVAHTPPERGRWHSGAPCAGRPPFNTHGTSTGIGDVLEMEGTARVDAVMRNAFGFGDDTHVSRVFLRPGGRSTPMRPYC